MLSNSSEKTSLLTYTLSDRIISLMTPNDSWVARWQRIGMDVLFVIVLGFYIKTSRPHSKGLLSSSLEKGLLLWLVIQLPKFGSWVLWESALKLEMMASSRAEERGPRKKVEASLSPPYSIDL